MVSVRLRRPKTLSISPSLLFPAIAPLEYLYLSFSIIVIIAIGSLWLVLNQPYLGLKLEKSLDSQGLTIVAADTPAAGKVVPGDIVLALLSGKREAINLNGNTLAEDPDFAATYRQYNNFFHQQKLIFEAAGSPELRLLLNDGRQAVVAPLPFRPLWSLPTSFWLLQIIGAIGFLIGVAIWSCRRNLVETRLLAIAGFCFMIGAASLSIYGSRELAFDPQLFRTLSVLNHFFNSIFSGSLILLLCYYPNRLVDRPLWAPGYAAVAMIWLNETLQIVEIPFHTFFVPLGILPMILGLELGRRQWLNSSRNPVAKASLCWLLFTLFAGCSGMVLILYMPVLLNERLPFPLWGAQLAMLGIFIGFVLCVIRFQIFNIDRWWKNLWLWFLAGLFLVSLDVLLAYFFRVNPFFSLSLSVFVTAWLYFPFRQWVLSLTKSELTLNPENFLLAILDLFTSNPTPEYFDKQWEERLTRFFRPLSIKHCWGGIGEATIIGNGLTLQIPAIGSDSYLELNGMERGARLFGEKEAALVQNTLDLARKSIEWNKTREEAIKQERERIVRDLHDDIGASLLTLIYTAQSEEQTALAKKALRDLRDTMHAIQDSKGMPLEECLVNWKDEIRQRLQPLSLGLDWHVPDEIPNHILTCRERINLDRIFREAVSNIIKHSRPEKVGFALQINGAKLVFVLDDYGAVADPSAWKPHVGLFNMQKRAAEIAAQVSWQAMALPHDTFNGVRLTVTLSR